MDGAFWRSSLKCQILLEKSGAGGQGDRDPNVCGGRLLTCEKSDQKWVNPLPKPENAC